MDFPSSSLRLRVGITVELQVCIFPSTLNLPMHDIQELHFCTFLDHQKLHRFRHGIISNINSTQFYGIFNDDFLKFIVFL